MDKTEQNIKMLEKAVEIQSEWVHSEKYPAFEGSFYYNGERVCVVDYEYPYPLLEDTGTIWLPQQDQLQEMIKIPDMIVINHHASPDFFMMSWREDLHIEDVDARTMEQLWLAFVMKEKYGKVWSGTDWRKK